MKDKILNKIETYLEIVAEGPIPKHFEKGVVVTVFSNDR